MSNSNKKILSIVSIIVLWMAGGQYNKAFRRFGITAIIIGLIIWKTNAGVAWWKLSPLFLIIPMLFRGYGVDSWIAKVFKKEWLIRVAYASMLSLPMALAGILQHKLIALLAIPLVIGAFQIRAGSLFHIGKKDFLIEDFFRSLSLGTGIWLAL